MKTNLFGKFFAFRVLVAWAVVTLVFSFGVAGVVRAFASTPAPLKAFLKIDYPVDDTVPEQVTPNLLFFFAADQFTTRGIVPSATDNRTLEQRADLLKNHTYGWGMRPVQFGSATALNSADEMRSFDYRVIDGKTFAFDKNWTSATDLGFSAFGRDLIEENNIIGNEAHYYTPFPEYPYLLTFKNRLLAWHKWVGGAPPSFPNTDEGRAAQTSYNAIQEYMPAADGTLKGHVPLELANWHLVPNDSRTYILKLALKNVLDIRNAELLSRVNIGVAHRTKEMIMTVAPTGGNPIRGWGVAMESYDMGSEVIGFKEKTPVQRAVPGELNYFGAQEVSPHGIPSTGYYSNSYVSRLDRNKELTNGLPLEEATTGVVDEQRSRMRQWTGRQGYVDVVGPDTYIGDRDLGVRTLRAQLAIPFDGFYVRNVDSFQPTTNLTNLMSWINGLHRWSSLTSSSNIAVHDDEITTIGEGIAAGISAAGIYGGRANSDSAKYGDPAVDRTYFQGSTHSRSTNTGKQHSNQYYIQYGVAPPPFPELKYHDDTEIKLKRYKTSEELWAGQVLGSINDFFSPRNTTSRTDGQDGLHANLFAGNEGFFPVTNSCQQNWVVIFTGGDDNLLGYSNAQAVELLFKNTLTMRGREPKSGGGWQEKNYSMASGVRTIVVALLDEALVKADTAGGGQAVVDGIYEMAAWGDPVLKPGANPKLKDSWIANPNPKPYFLTDTDQLMEALNVILRRVVAGDMGSGAPVSFEGNNADGSHTLLTASFKMNGDDQWKAQLKRTDRDKNGKQIFPGGSPWEADAKMRAAASNDARRLFTLKNGNNAELSALNVEEWNTLAGVSVDAVRFKDWLYKFNDSSKEPIGILGDVQHSNIMFIGKSLTSNIAPRDRMLYLQTNRGFLHAIDYETGVERWAFVPPNIFEGRLKYLKFTATFMSGQSKPMFLLQGKLTANDVFGENKTLLTGYLGRGGNGFYVMDVTSPDNPPKFLWAIENTYYGTGTAHSDLVKKWGATTSGNYNYSKLGLTIVPGVLLTPKVQLGNGNGASVIALPGGLGHKLGKDDDEQGKVLYFFNPMNGNILHTIDLAGMGVTPITYQEGKYVNDITTKLKYTQSFYTADSDGNILFFDLSDEEKTLTDAVGTDVAAKKIFRLTTTADASPGTSVVIPHAMASGRSEVGDRWLFGGTANIPGPYSKSLTSDDRTLVNKEQFFFGLNVSNLPDANQTTRDLEKGTYYKDEIVPKYDTETVSFLGPVLPNVLVRHDTKGWYLKLRPALPIGASVSITDPEYVTAPPYLFSGYLFMATFIPYSGSSSSKISCLSEDIGVGKVYMLSPTTGEPITGVVPAAGLLNVKIVGFSGVGDRLYMSVQELTPGALTAAMADFEKEGMEPKIEEPYSMLSIRIPVPVNLPDIPMGKPYIQYWREDFN